MLTLRRFICRRFHSQIFRPINGRYRCQTCLQEFEVPWMAQPAPADIRREEREQEA